MGVIGLVVAGVMGWIVGLDQRGVLGNSRM